MCIRKIYILLFLTTFAKLTFAQDYTWWNQIHNWDGYTSWLKYLTYSPAYFGPNALPVPDIQNGEVGKNLEIEVSGEYHFSKGDKTRNLYTRIYYPIVKNIVAVEGYVVPLEHFKMDTTTRDIRGARLRSGEGFAGGDIYFGTSIQIVKNKKIPDIAFRMMCRTASGTNVSAARYTDAPGYFFDLSFGKTMLINKELQHTIRPHLMLGFYSWQTNLDDHRQNDAFLYGIGTSFSINKFEYTTSLAGYKGYIKNGDSPMIAEIKILHKRKLFNYSLAIKQGLNDFSYTRVKLAFIYCLKKKE